MPASCLELWSMPNAQENIMDKTTNSAQCPEICDSGTVGSRGDVSPCNSL